MKLNKFIALTMLGCFAFPIIAAESAVEAKEIVADDKAAVKKVAVASKAKVKKVRSKKKHAHHATKPRAKDSVECNAPVQPATLLLTTPTSTPDGYMKVKENLFIGIHGYAQANVNYDFKGYAGDFVEVNAIPYGPATSKNVLSMHVKQTRLNLESLAKTTIGDVKARLEMDFYGDVEGADVDNEYREHSNSYKPRMRHAYVEAAGFLVGQTESLFTSVYEIPMVNFQGMFGYSKRQMQVRYTFNENEPLTFAVALAQPKSDFTSIYGAKLGAHGNDNIPDFTAKLNYTMDGHGVNLRGVLRQLKAEKSTKKMGWGVGLNGKIQVAEGSNLVALIDYGTGIGRYMSELEGQSFIFDSTNNKIELQKMLTWGAGYSHRFCEQWQVNLGYSQNSVKQAKILEDGANPKSLERMFFNVIYSPVKDLNVALEYGNYRHKSMKTELFPQQKGIRDRVSLAVQYKF